MEIILMVVTEIDGGWHYRASSLDILNLFRTLHWDLNIGRYYPPIWLNAGKIA